MTSPETTEAEIIAGVAAAKKILDDTSKVPRWARKMISDDQITALVAAVVDAVDAVRDRQIEETPNEHP